MSPETENCNLNTNLIDINDYYYSLPEEKIAKFPLDNRDKSKLLIYKNGICTTEVFSDIQDFLPVDSFLVFNNTRVIRARLLFKKESGANIEVLCLEPSDPPQYEAVFSSNKPVEWNCIIGNLKRWKSGKLILPVLIKENNLELTAEKMSQEGENVVVRFSWNSESFTFGEVLEASGHIPLPPYLNRPDTEADAISYQTVYSKIQGSVAAPTAGLHFTEKVLGNIKTKGHKTAEVTLHVGAGTFMPVKSRFVNDHSMHTEHYSVSRELIENLIDKKNKIIAVGTTSVRTLESLYWLGIKIMQSRETTHELFTSQWEPYENEISIPASDALSALIDYTDKIGIKTIRASTQIMIVPGYRFRVTDGIITNFHQPKSTLLLLVAAFAGEKWKEIYNYALANDFRFLSYGDSSLLL